MSKIEDGGPAFPQFAQPAFLVRKGALPDVVEFKAGDVLPIETPQVKIIGSGMSLRDWFAGQALNECLKFMSGNTPEDSYNRASAEAYMIADAMLAARKTGGSDV
jgi:hypothetical protein